MLVSYDLQRDQAAELGVSGSDTADSFIMNCYTSADAIIVGNRLVQHRSQSWVPMYTYPDAKLSSQSQYR